MRKFFQYVFGVLVLLTVALASMLITMRLAIHGREVAVPKMIGMTPSEAERVANDNGLLLSRENRFYSATIAEGRVVSQVPSPGEKVRRGWRVRIAESLGPQRIVIPNIIGQSPRAAELNVRRRGLELGTVSALAMADLPPDQVVAQSPPPEAQDVASPKVSMLVTGVADEKAFVMPDLTGAKLAEASVAVEDAGMKVGKVTTAKTENGSTPDPNANPQPKKADAGEPVIVKQTPAPGQKVAPGTTVLFEVVRQ